MLLRWNWVLVICMCMGLSLISLQRGSKEDGIRKQKLSGIEQYVKL